MKLSVSERLVASNLLPQQGTFINLRLVRVAKEELSFNEKESLALKFQHAGDRISWDQKVILFKEVNLDQITTLMIVNELKRLDAKGALKDEHISLYEKLVENVNASIH